MWEMWSRLTQISNAMEREWGLRLMTIALRPFARPATSGSTKEETSTSPNGRRFLNPHTDQPSDGCSSPVSWVSFEIPIRVVGKPRPRVTRFGTYTPKPARVCEATIKAFLTEWAKKKGLQAPMDGCLEAQVIVTYAVPKSYSKKERAACLVGLLPVRDYDIDNILKTVLDASNGVLWADDKSIVRIIAEKKYGTTPQLLLRVRAV